jgi:hypothetical protein
VQEILTDRPDLIDAWISGKGLHLSEFAGEISDYRGHSAMEGLDPLSYAIARDVPSQICSFAWVPIRSPSATMGTWGGAPRSS